jgi:Holliday junction resolvasome RuvABC endonuclease subunit
MISMGIDNASKKLGYSIMQDRVLIEYGVMEETDDNVFERMCNLYNRIEEKVNLHKVECIIIEDTFFSTNIKVLKVLSQLQGVIMALCFKHDIMLRLYLPSEWRKIVGLKGKKRAEQKLAAIEYVNNKYGFSLKKKDDDIAEAIMINEAFNK